MNKEIIYNIDGLDCAHCAANLEKKIKEQAYIEDATLVFSTKQLRVTPLHNDNPLAQLQQLCTSVEEGVILSERSNGESAASNIRFNIREYSTDIISIIIGSALLLLAVGLRYTDPALPFIIAMFIISYLILGWPVLWAAMKTIGKGHVFDENFLMSIATISAFGISQYPEGVGVMLFYRIGELFEHIAVEKSRSQIMSAVDMRPETVTLVGEHHNTVVAAEDAKCNDIILVLPGDRIPLDGVVVEGISRLDTSPVTGEPVPVSISEGSEILSGCLNQSGTIKLRVTKELSDSMVSRILDSVENAAAGKPKIHRFITSFARIYTPIVVILAVLTAIIPSLVTGDWGTWVTTAITFLVISCPCALVISVPLSFFSGIGVASKFGILFKGGIAIEALRKVKAIAMDKTGTLTEGNFKVQSIHSYGNTSENDILSLAASCEINSNHPIATSIVSAAHQRNLAITHASSMEELAGMGIEATISQGTVICGNRKLMLKYGVGIKDETSEEAVTIVYVALNGTLIGSITIYDTIKSDAASAISEIKSIGLLPSILTGDLKAGAMLVAEKTGIDKIYSQLLPEEKLDTLIRIRNEAGPVMFVGDGINDAPVLANADVGAAMGSGADAAIEAADVVFMNSTVGAIPQAFRIAKDTGTIAMENIIFALTIKLVFIILGFLQLANIWAAVFADTGVAMICILNSLRLLHKKY